MKRSLRLERMDGKAQPLIVPMVVTALVSALLVFVIVLVVNYQTSLKDERKLVENLDAHGAIFDELAGRYEYDSINAAAETFLESGTVSRIAINAKIDVSRLALIGEFSNDEERLPLNVYEVDLKHSIINFGYSPVRFTRSLIYAFGSALAALFFVFIPLSFYTWYAVSLFINRPLDRLTIAVEETIESGMPRLAEFEQSSRFGRFISLFNLMQQKILASQKQVEQSKEVLRDVVASASDWFWETDTTGAYVSLSERFTELTGLNSEDFLHKSVEEISSLLEDAGSLDTLRDYRKWLKAIHSQIPFRNLPGVIETPSGLLHVVHSGIPILDDDGKCTGIRGSTLDRTALYLSEREKEEMSEQLSHSERLRSIGQLTGGIAHDFNNLLATMQGNLELLKLELLDHPDKDLEGYADNAIASVERGASLTHRLLAYARKQPLNPKAIEPKAIIVDLDDLLQRALGETVTVDLLVGGDAWNAYADVHQLELALLNLAINARDAMPDGGRLTIKAQNVQVGRDFSSSSFDLQEGQYVCFTVSDNGAGMSEDVLAKAADPFFTTKQAGKGSGLGLSMVFGFAKQSGGHLKIYSEFGRGTTVKLYLPRHRGNNVSTSMGSESVDQSPVDDGQTMIMVIEDEKGVRETTIKQLQSVGYSVIGADSGEKALKLLDTGVAVNLFLVDVILPGILTGRALSKTLIEQRPNASLVFMSGYTASAIIHQGKLDSDVVLLQKPFSMKQLIETVQHMLHSKIGPPEDGVRHLSPRVNKVASVSHRLAQQAE